MTISPIGLFHGDYHLNGVTLNSGGALKTQLAPADTALLAAFNTNTLSYTTFATLTAGNPPTFDLSTSTTVGGSLIVRGTLTNHYALVGGTSNTVTSVAPSATSGVPFISQGAAADPAFGTAVVAGGGTGSTSFNTYGPVVAGATSTTALTSVSPSATSGVPFISQGSSANPAFGTAVVAGGGTGNTTFTSYAVVCGGTTATGNLQSVAGVGTSGQVLTSNGASNLPTWQNASAGGITTLAGDSGTATGSTVTLAGAGGITTSASGSTVTITGSGGGGLTYTNATGTTQAMATDTVYIATSNGTDQLVFTLPSSGTVGDVVGVVGKVSGGWQIAQNSGQTIHFGNIDSTTGTGGSLTSTNRYDAIQLVCTVTDTDWTCIGVSQGNITVV